jgi:hypothetical protein
VADVYSLGVAYIISGLLYLIQFPFVLAARRMRLPADDTATAEVVSPS